MPIPLKKDTIEQANKPVIIEAFASWCPHCTKMRPIFEQLEKDLGANYIFSRFDVDEDEELTSQFGIQSLPTFIFIKNKSEVGREMGEMSSEDLKGFIEKYLK